MTLDALVTLPGTQDSPPQLPAFSSYCPCPPPGSLSYCGVVVRRGPPPGLALGVGIDGAICLPFLFPAGMVVVQIKSQFYPLSFSTQYTITFVRKET